MFVYTGYLDESGTHDGSPITVMGGIIARADQWVRFENGFAKLQKNTASGCGTRKNLGNEKAISNTGPTTNDMLQTITVADKDSCGQLMMADYATHGEYMLHQRVSMSKRQQIPPSMKIPKGMTGWTNVKVTAEELAKTRAEIIENASPRRRNTPATAQTDKALIHRQTRSDVS